MVITSLSNDRIKRLVRLRDRRHRDAEGVYLAEGRDMRRAVSAGWTPREVYLPAGALNEIEAEQVFACSGSVLSKVSYRSDSTAIIGVFDQFPLDLDRIHLSQPALVLVAEATEKPGNVGAIARTGDAVGADGLIVTDSDIYNPNVIRSSTGAIFSLMVARAPIGEALAWLTSNGVQIVAGVPHGGEAPWNVDLTQPVALLVGSEDQGVSQRALDAASATVTIPTNGKVVDSLNASVSMAVLAFEVIRQRA